VLISTDTGAVLLRFVPERSGASTAVALSPSRRELLVCAEGFVAIWPLVHSGAGQFDGPMVAVGLGAVRVISDAAGPARTQAGEAPRMVERRQRQALACEWGSVKPIVLAGA
jgi:hypothetical protein